MTGRTILITGGTSGIGLAVAEQMARQGWRVAIVGRNQQRCESTISSIRHVTSNDDVRFLVADLSSQDSVRRLADEFTRRFDALHVLVNNAGALFMNRHDSADGIEMTFALNHLAPFLLTNLLLGLIRDSVPARIINVSSSGHRLARGLRTGDLEWRRAFYRGFKVYHHSKLANLLFTYELARRLQSTGVTVNAVDPGLVATNLGKNNPRSLTILKPLLNMLWGLRYVDAREGARTIVYLATAPDVAGITGGFYANQHRVASSPASHDAETARWLWEASARLTRLPGD
jgi:NAD(P)-dependent dehydrogenase (short-subunit alcohol dehydrogenase family)